LRFAIRYVIMGKMQCEVVQMNTAKIIKDDIGVYSEEFNQKEIGDI